MTTKKTTEDFLVENQELRRQLEEAEEILNAIRYDQIDAVVVLGPEGHQVHLLRRDNRNYRILVETICEGTVVMTGEGSIFFCNSRFSEMVGNAVETLIGSPILSYVPEEEHGEFNSLLVGEGDVLDLLTFPKYFNFSRTLHHSPLKMDSCQKQTPCTFGKLAEESPLVGFLDLF